MWTWTTWFHCTPKKTIYTTLKLGPLRFFCSLSLTVHHIQKKHAITFTTQWPSKKHCFLQGIFNKKLFWRRRKINFLFATQSVQIGPQTTVNLHGSYLMFWVNISWYKKQENVQSKTILNHLYIHNLPKVCQYNWDHRKILLLRNQTEKSFT